MMPVVAPPVAACPWERARYELIGDPGATIITAAMTPGWGRPDLALRFRWRVTGRALWYFGDRGSASIEHLISIDDPTIAGWLPPDPDGRRGRPGPDLVIMGYAANLSGAEAVARRGDLAPTYLVVPETADIFRVGAERPPNTIYHLTACLSP